MEGTYSYTLPTYPSYTNNRDVDVVVNGIYRHEYSIAQLIQLAKNLPDDVQRVIVRARAGIAGEALHCLRLAQEKASELVNEAFGDAEPEMTLQGTPIKKAAPIERDKALKLLMTANADLVKQAAQIKALDVEAITLDAIQKTVRDALTDEQWVAFQRDLDDRIMAATKKLMG